MTSVSSNNFFKVDFSQVKKLDLPSNAVRKLTDEEITKFDELRKALYSKPVNLDDLKNHVSQQIYAEVKVNGQTVATLYNGGGSMTSNATAGKIMSLPSMGEDETSTGPELAQKRAEEIARALGGTIIKSPTAVTQGQYVSTPAFKTEYAVDYEAMDRDKRRAEGRVATPQTQVDTQTLAQSGNIDAESATSEFMEFMSKTTEEQMYDLMLKQKGLTAEELASMEPTERAKIEAEIKAMIEAKIREKTGIEAVPTAASA